MYLVCREFWSSSQQDKGNGLVDMHTGIHYLRGIFWSSSFARHAYPICVMNTKRGVFPRSRVRSSYRKKKNKEEEKKGKEKKSIERRETPVWTNLERHRTTRNSRMEGRPAFLSGYGESENTKDTLPAAQIECEAFILPSCQFKRQVFNFKTDESFRIPPPHIDRVRSSRDWFYTRALLYRTCLLTVQSEQKPPFLPHVGATVTHKKNVPDYSRESGKVFRGISARNRVKNWFRVRCRRYWVVRSIIEAWQSRWNVDRYRRSSIWERLGELSLCCHHC